LPEDELMAIERHFRELDRLGEDLGMLDREIAQAAIDNPAVKRLLTVSGINLTVAAGVTAAIGDIKRFASPQKLVSYVGLIPECGNPAWLRPARPDQQAWPGTCTRHAGRGGVGRRQGAGAIPCLLSSR
jgi:hypothetical protein